MTHATLEAYVAAHDALCSVERDHHAIEHCQCDVAQRWFRAQRRARQGLVPLAAAMDHATEDMVTAFAQFCAGYAWSRGTQPGEDARVQEAGQKIIDGLLTLLDYTTEARAIEQCDRLGHISAQRGFDREEE